MHRVSAGGILTVILYITLESLFSIISTPLFHIDFFFMAPLFGVSSVSPFNLSVIASLDVFLDVNVRTEWQDGRVYIIFLAVANVKMFTDLQFEHFRCMNGHKSHLMGSSVKKKQKQTSKVQTCVLESLKRDVSYSSQGR